MMILSTQNHIQYQLLHILQAASGYRLKVVANVYCSLSSSYKLWGGGAYASEGNLEQTTNSTHNTQTLNQGSDFVKVNRFSFPKRG
jgi:hypothetical protein